MRWDFKAVVAVAVAVAVAVVVVPRVFCSRYIISMGWVYTTVDCACLVLEREGSLVCCTIQIKTSIQLEEEYPGDVS
jgi:hypothetical protein